MAKAQPNTRKEQAEVLQDWVCNRTPVHSDSIYGFGEIIISPGELLARWKAGEIIGDCDDKATLLAALLVVSGFQTRVVIIDAGGGSIYNHAVTQVYLDGVWLWLEATQKGTPPYKVRRHTRRLVVDPQGAPPC